MEPGQVFAIVLLITLVAGLTFALTKLLDRLRRKDAESEAREIIHRAEMEGENRRRAYELELKEMAIQQKSEGEKELRRIREELH